MRRRIMTALLFTMVLAGPAAAQRDDSQQATTTQDSGNYDTIWNLVGLLGILGLFGFWRSTDNDGYTEDTAEFR